MNRRLAPPVDALGLGLGDPFHLPLAAKVGLELGEDAEHVEEGFARRRRGVDRLFRGLERHSRRAQLMHDVLQVLDRPGQTIDARHHQGVAAPQKLQQHRQF